MRTKLLSLKTLLVICLMAIVGGVETWAQTTEKVDFTAQGYTDKEKVASYVGDNFSVAFSKGSSTDNPPMYYNSGTSIRFYRGNTMTISSSTKIISKVVFTYSGNKYTPSIATGYNLSSGSYSVKYNTWTADAKNQTQSVTFTNANTSQYRIKTIEVTFASGEEESVATPTITPASQEFDAPFVATIACTTTGATIYYTLDGTDPTTSSPSRKTYTSEGVSILAATTTLKACASLNGKNSSVASATYTYSQTYANLKELKANAENGKTYKVKLTDAIVTLTNGNNCYIEDATAGILYYKQKHGYIKGDKLNGVATVTYTVFKGINQITSLEGDITKEADATIPCTTVTLSDILNNTAQYENMRVKVEMAVAKDIFKDNTDRDATIADGDLELPLFNGFAGSTYKEFRENAYVNVTGYPYVYVNKGSSTPTLKVWTGDIEAVKDDAVKITDAQYGTAYYADAFFMPTGATGYVAESNGNGGITLKETYAEGDLVPAKTALVLNAPKGNYDICLAESDAIAPNNNLLHGTTTEKLTEVEGGTYKYYKLSYNNEGNNLGFYWGSENGAAFTNGAHKAYLALNSETLLSQSRGFSLADLAHGVTTGINTTVKSATQSNFIYDLNGRRINSLNGAAKGVYIMNGQKVLVK
uniref:chitobiase/beta-hexosaminidase C-terminal domain-containing protein n=1 Tax=Alloprevotella sp. TaxID=1872471 RepID=UPI003FF10480